MPTSVITIDDRSWEVEVTRVRVAEYPPKELGLWIDLEAPEHPTRCLYGQGHLLEQVPLAEANGARVELELEDVSDFMCMLLGEITRNGVGQYAYIPVEGTRIIPVFALRVEVQEGGLLMSAEHAFAGEPVDVVESVERAVEIRLFVPFEVLSAMPEGGA